jgi:hypothetical protein
MGKEAITRAQVGAEHADVRALLESTEIILRGGIRRHFARDQLADIYVDGDALTFLCDGERVALFLGAEIAGKWAKTLRAPPPSLRAKLGLDKGARAFLIGQCDDVALTAALAGTLVADSTDADMLIACIEGTAELQAALAIHAPRPHMPLWAVYPKGRGLGFGESAIREALRAAGLRDSKACAVSDRLTATRYSKPRRGAD